MAEFTGVEPDDDDDDDNVTNIRRATVVSDEHDIRHPNNIDEEHTDRWLDQDMLKLCQMQIDTVRGVCDCPQCRGRFLAAIEYVENAPDHMQSVVIKYLMATNILLAARLNNTVRMSVQMHTAMDGLSEALTTAFAKVGVAFVSTQHTAEVKNGDTSGLPQELQDLLNQLGINIHKMN